MDKLLSLGLVISVVVGLALTFTMAIYSDNFAQNHPETMFENIQIFDVTENSAVLVSFTQVSLVCEVGYAESINDFSAPKIVTHDSVPHTEHIVQVTDLAPNTEYEYVFFGEYDGEKFLSEKETFTTL